MPTVSVVIIFRNADRFLAEAIDSVFSQSYSDWELLLVDDCSTDGSACLARDYADRWPARIRYLQHDGGVHRGMSASRNLGVAHSVGKYVAFLDADDVWMPTKLELQVAVLDANPRVSMVQGPMMYWHSWSGLPEDAALDRIYLDGIDFPLDAVVEPPQMFPRYFRIDGPGIMTLLVRRNTYDKVGGFEDIFTGMFEDAAFVLKVYLSEPVFVSSECLGRYRQHPDSCCRQADQQGDSREAGLNLFEWLESYLAAKNISDPMVWRTVNRQAWPLRHPQLYRWRPANVARAMKSRLGKLGGFALRQPQT